MEQFSEDDEISGPNEGSSGSYKGVHSQIHRKKLQDLVPEVNDFKIIESIIPILTKFENVCDFMQSETYPTICHVMVKICFLQLSLKKAMESSPEDSPLHMMSDNMAKDLEKRFPNYGSGEKAFAFTHLLHPGQKGTILYQQSIFNQTCQIMIEDEEGAPEEVGLDVAMHADSDEDEEQQMLASMSQAMPKSNPNDDSPMMQEIVAYISGGLLPGKNLDVLSYWKNHAKQFPLLAKVQIYLLIHTRFIDNIIEIVRDLTIIFSKFYEINR